MKQFSHIAAAVCATVIVLMSACRSKPSNDTVAVTENLYEDTISTSYTVAMPDDHGEGLRITYTFFNMKRADTGSFRMTHVYMRHTGEEDTTIVNGTWKLQNTDSGTYVNTWSGRAEVRFFQNSTWNLITLNTDSMVADTGWLNFRQKKDNDMHNSTVVMFGKVMFSADKNATFLDQSGDSLSVLKISAFPDLLALNDSVNLNGSTIQGVEILGTIQIRMAMDGRSISRSLIVEEVRGVK